MITYNLSHTGNLESTLNVWDLGLPESQKETLMQTLAHVNSLALVHPKWGKTTSVALGALLLAWTYPGRRIACFASSYRSSKKIYYAINWIIENVPLLQMTIKECYMGNSGWFFVFNSADGLNPSRIDSFSLSDCYRIKGYRCHTAILDDAVTIPEDTFNAVIRPMLAVSVDPVTAVRFEKEKDNIIKMNYLSDKMKSLIMEEMGRYCVSMRQMKNQVIIFSDVPTFNGHYLLGLHKTWSENKDCYTVMVT